MVRRSLETVRGQKSVTASDVLSVPASEDGLASVLVWALLELASEAKSVFSWDASSALSSELRMARVTAPSLGTAWAQTSPLHTGSYKNTGS